MSVSEIVTVKISLDVPVAPVRLIIGTDQQLFINRIKQLGEDWLEYSMTSAIVVHTTSDIESLPNYLEVRDEFKNSHRVLGHSLWCRDAVSVNEMLSCMFDSYEVVEVVGPMIEGLQLKVSNKEAEEAGHSWFARRTWADKQLGK